MRGALFNPRSIALFVLLTLAPITASAQAVASNFQELRFKVKPGDTVYVTDDAGREKIIYETAGSTSRRSFGVSPVVSPRVRGVRVSVSF